MLELYAEALDCSLQDLLPRGKKKILYDKRNDRINRIIERFVKIYDLPDDEREELLTLIENALNLVLRDNNSKTKKTADRKPTSL